MRVFWLNFVAILIAVASFQVHDLDSFACSSGYNTETISSVAAWDIDPLRGIDSKSNFKKQYIAQDFFPIVTIAELQIETPAFIYYLPVHNLIREKKYFLLI